MLVVNLLIFLLTMIYLLYRSNKAVKSGDMVGFLLNPLLYFVFFGLLYLIFSNILVSLGAFNILPTGLPENINLKTHSSIYTTLFFVSLLFCYIFSKDIKGLQFSLLKYKPYNEFFLNFIVVMIFLLMTYILISHYKVLLSLRGDRASVYGYFANDIYKPYKLGVVVNVYSAVLIFLSLSKNKMSRFIVLLPFLIFALLDFLQGGRSIIIRLIVILYIIFAIKKNKLYIYQSFVCFVVLSIVFVWERLSSSSGLAALFTVFGEFIFTRLTVDYVLYYNLHGDWYTALLKYVLSVFPGKLNGYFLEDEIGYAELISNYSGLSWGLAGNIVSEALFYFGNGFIFSIVFVMLTCLVHYNRYTIMTMPFFIINIIYISNIQNIFRASVFEFGLVMLYLSISYLFLFSFLFFRKRSLSKRLV
ncbi:hypothetical protein M3923_002840 [Vibrio metschnikovii]|nr:hypothetical protein [Vibrio metschnikovii]